MRDCAEENVSGRDRRERAVGRDRHIGQGPGTVAADPLAGYDDSLQFDVLRDDRQQDRSPEAPSEGA